MFGGRDLGGVAMSGSLLTFFLARGDRPPEVTVQILGSGASRRGWLVASCTGAVAFFALEAVAREPGEASDLAATDSDQGTTGQIVAAYGLAAGLSPMLTRSLSN